MDHQYRAHCSCLLVPPIGDLMPNSPKCRCCLLILHLQPHVIDSPFHSCPRLKSHTCVLGKFGLAWGWMLPAMTRCLIDKEGRGKTPRRGERGSESMSVRGERHRKIFFFVFSCLLQSPRLTWLE